MRRKIKSKIFLVFFLWLFLFLPVSVFGQQRAADLVKKIDEQLQTGKVLKVMKWDPESQTMVVFDPLIDSEDSLKNFSLEAGSSYFVLTDVKGVEFVDLPFEIETPKITDGWNLIPWKSDLIEKYDIKQITCFNSEFQQYEDIIVDFNDEILPAEGQGCWLYVGQGKETEGTPHAIYGKVFLEGGGTKATISVINSTNGKHGITETDENGKFAYDLLNLGWKAGDKIIINANSDGVQKEVVLDVDSQVPNQAIEINLQKPAAVVPVPPSRPERWLPFLGLGLCVALLILAFIIKKLKKKK